MKKLNEVKTAPFKEFPTKEEFLKRAEKKVNHKAAVKGMSDKQLKEYINKNFAGGTSVKPAYTQLKKHV